MVNYIIWQFKKLLNRDRAGELLPYRKYLFNELIDLYPKEKFFDKRILEIGPRDGDDTQRLVDLKPKKLTLIDLPQDDRDVKWLEKIDYDYEFIEKNFLYMNRKEIEALGKFDLIYFTGIIYHNAEQLRFIQKLYELLNQNGVLVLESSTIRNIILRNLNIVQIWYPNSFRNTSTITHMPSKKALKSWLRMVGFNKIYDSDCFKFENFNIKDIRYACIAEKNSDGVPGKYYTKQSSKSNYLLGNSE